MTVGGQVFSGKGAREEAARALVRAVLSRPYDHTLRKHATFRGFEILTRGQPAAPVPDLFIRGAGTYSAHVNAGNPIGTMQSIKHTLRALDRIAADQQQQLQRIEKTLTGYQAQDQRPFEHEARLKELLTRQAQLNAALGLDKSDAKAAETVPEPDLETAMLPSRIRSVMRGLQPNSVTAPIP
ncbi:MAG: hypothetical protein ACLQU2_33890 [Candidatus Binataceae bacterium]